MEPTDQALYDKTKKRVYKKHLNIVRIVVVYWCKPIKRVLKKSMGQSVRRIKGKNRPIVD